MGSRRLSRPPSFGNGRSSSGEETSGRSAGCSYLSNVRPETRSTLCSMMAQLTEETQPSFETTLRSRAVSEKCNVKFSCVVTGHPVPQVLWYKDDVQLDRYCGLPKYEIFRNGQSHSLHIYDCTVEDAAIYQASASNSKGIVSCSGVLEVGEMNEFKIHQRYFGKLKQKAENRRREAEGKENQEPLRTISPDRTQRKRRSTMEAYLSTPSSTEDEGNEESHEPGATESEARLQEAPVEEAEEKPVPMTKGAVPALTNGQAVSENANKSGMYFYDPNQKIFTAHQPKIPFIKKKIKISNSAKVAKADTPTEHVPEEKPSKDGLSSLAPASTESVRCEVDSEEVMEVENVVSSSAVATDSSDMIDLQKAETETVFHTEMPPKDKNACVETNVPSQKKEISSTSCIVSGTDGRQASKEKEAGRTHVEGREEMQNQSVHISPKPRQTRAAAPQQPGKAKEDISKTGHVAVMEVDEKSNAPPVAPLTPRDSVNAPCEVRAALPQSPCEQTRDQLSDKETSRCQNTVSVSQPALLSEVEQAHTPMTRNDAPVNLEPALNRHRADTLPPPPQNTPSVRDTSTDDIQSPSSNGGPQAAIDKMTQDTRDHSRGSNESHTVLFTGLQKSPLQIPGGGENTRGCNVSPSRQQNQVDTAIKAVEGTEIQVREEVEGTDGDRLIVQSPDEKVVEMETESIALQVTEQTEGEQTTDAAGRDIVIVDAASKATEKNEDTVKIVEDTHSELHKLKSNTSEHTIPFPTKPSENTKVSAFQMNDFQEIQKPVTKIISIAELLRSIKALESMPANSESTTPLSTETREILQEADSECKPDKKKSAPARNCGTDERPPKNIKETLMEIYNLLNMADQKQSVTQDASSPPVQALQKPPVTPEISVVDAGPIAETVGLDGKKYNGDVRDNYQKPPASMLTTDCATVSLSGSESVKHGYSPSSCKDELTKMSVSELGTPFTVTPPKASNQEPKVSVLEIAKDEPVQGSDVGSMQSISPEIQPHSKTERTPGDRFKIEERNTTTGSLSVSSESKIPIRNGHDADTQGSQPKQHDTSGTEEFSRTNSFTVPKTPEASPLLKRRNCASPIPSATAQELASGARRKILTPKAKPEEAPGTGPVSLSMSPSLSRKSPLLQPPAERTPPTERRSPLLNRRRMTSESQTPNQPPTQDTHSHKTEGKPAEKDKHDPFKAPQVIRKIRSETFADASGHLKLWCQFFNILSDCTIKWYKNEMEIAQIKRSAGDETQVNLAIVQASSKDAGVYGCTITNEYGTDSTDCLLSSDILAGLSICEDLGVGEEIEMTPMVFSKGVADSGTWGSKFFGRIMMQESRIGDGCSHKVWRAKVIYGLEPVFESGNTCIIKACNPIAYGGKGESCLIDRNLDTVKQECKIQNLAREYCKIFSTEARVIENFGPSLEVIPVYLMYRPANTIPYATVEPDLSGVYQKYCSLDASGSMEVRTGSQVEQKCCALQHWIFQWTSGNLLLTRLEGVDTKITNVGISVKSTGHQGLSIEGSPKVFEQFVSQHQCNYFCGLLGLRSLKIMDSLLTPAKPKASKSPLLQRKMAGGSSSPQTGRKAAGSPRMPRKTEQEGRKTPTKQKSPKVVQME